MVSFERFTLANGLKVLVHEDPTTPMAVVNILYDVGARDEHPDQTGFAHLFEHLMFGGSVNIPSYDEPLQRVGGENNAFTSNDITLTARAGYGLLSLNVGYSITPVLRDGYGPSFNRLSVGLSISGL